MSDNPSNWTVELANKRPNFPATVRAVAARLGKFRWGVVAVVGCGIAASIMEMVTIGLMYPLMQTLMGRETLALSSHPALRDVSAWLTEMTVEHRIRLLLFVMLGLQIAREAINYASQLISLRVSSDFAIRLRLDTFDRIVGAPLIVLDRMPVARHYTSLNSFSHNAADLMLSVMKGIPPSLAMVAYFVLMFAVSPALTGMAAAIVAVVLLATTLILTRQTSWYSKATGRGGDVNQVALELLSAIRTVKLFGRESLMRDRQQDSIRAYWRCYLNSQKYGLLVGPFGQVMGMTGVVSIFVVGTFLYAKTNAYWIETLLVFLFILARLATPASQINNIRAEIGVRLPGAAAYIDYIDAMPSPPSQPPSAPFDPRADIHFENVGFAYRDGGAPAVTGIDFVLPHGRTTAIVGRSGAGKSTVVDLLLKIVEPTTGRILVGDRDLRTPSEADWRRHLAVVSQNAFLFADTIRENIRFGRPDATDAEIERAASAANLDSVLARLPRGLETWVGERGTQLSGGQAQRVAIARAMLADPAILVLDEATSAQDAISEREIQDAIERLARNRTVLVVAHRLATVRAANQILVMEAGAVVERGTHAELLAAGGLYARFVKLQDLRA